MFEQAVRGKYRWSYKGSLSVEDLWDLSLRQLDEIFKALSREVRAASEESLLDTESAEDKVLRDKIAIVRYIVGVKLAEREAARSAAANKEQKEKLLGILSEKQDAQLRDLSPEELQQMIANL